MSARKRSTILIAALLAITIPAVLAWLLVTRLLPHEYAGFVRVSDEPIPDFELVAAGSKPVRLSDFRGKLVALYFGYTFCPDVCPTTLAELARGLKRMGRNADQVQVIMVTVDPERDTPEVLAEYVARFDPRFIGLGGTPEQIARAAAVMGIYYKRHEGTAASGYLVDHTATVAVIDQKGYLRLAFPYGTPGADIANDLAHLLR